MAIRKVNKMFNYKKAKKNDEKIEEKLLDDNRKENNSSDHDKDTKIINKLLDDERTEEKESGTIGKQLETDHTTEDNDVQTLEALMDEQDLDDEYPQRTEKDQWDVLPTNLLTEANDQERYKKFEETETEKREPFVKEVNSQLEGEPVKQKLQPDNTQLQNHWTRFKDLTPEKVKKNPKIKKMILASLSDVDAMTYYIYRTAFSENREPNAEENRALEMVREDREKIINLLK